MLYDGQPARVGHLHLNEKLSVAVYYERFYAIIMNLLNLRSTRVIQIHHNEYSF